MVICKHFSSHLLLFKPYRERFAFAFFPSQIAFMHFFHPPPWEMGSGTMWILVAVVWNKFSSCSLHYYKLQPPNKTERPFAEWAVAHFKPNSRSQRGTQVATKSPSFFSSNNVLQCCFSQTMFFNVFSPQTKFHLSALKGAWDKESNPKLNHRQKFQTGRKKSKNWNSGKKFKL